MKIRSYMVLASILVVASCEKPTGKTPAPKQWHVSTVAGSGTRGYKDAKGINAQFYFPSGIAVSSDGTLYVADTSNDRIRKIDTSGVVTTIAGSTVGYKDATGEAAQFNLPYGIAVSSDGTLYVADTENHRIRKIDTSGVVTTIAGSDWGGGHKDATGTDAQFNFPSGVAVTSDGTLYVADGENHRIRKIDTSGAVTTIAGSDWGGHKDATGTDAQFSSPRKIAVSSDGTLYVTDTEIYLTRESHLIRKIDTSGVVTTIAGSTAGYKDATGEAAQFNLPYGIAVSSDGTLYVADRDNHRIRKIDTSGDVTTIAGSTAGYKDATGEAAQFYHPYGIAVSPDGTLYVADTESHRIRKIEFK